MVVSFRCLLTLCCGLSLICHPSLARAADNNAQPPKPLSNPLTQTLEKLLDESELKTQDEADGLRKTLHDADQMLTRIKQENSKALKQVNRKLPNMAIGTPNIIFLLVDQLDPAMIGAYGSTVTTTPALDRVASEGVRFNDFHAGSPLDLDSFWCALMGHGPMAISRDKSGNPKFSSPRSVLMSVAWHAGYSTGFFGAWPVGGSPSFQSNYTETFVGFSGGDECSKAYPAVYHVNSAKKNMNGQVFAWSMTTMQAIAAMERENSPERPFCYVVRYHGIDLPAGELGEVIPAATLSEGERARAARCSRFDVEVNRILTYLDQKNKQHNTLLIVAGETSMSWNVLKNASKTAKTAPVAEAALRVPLLVRWPRLISGGRSSNELCAIWDLVPTLATIFRDTRYFSTNNDPGQSLYQALVGGGSGASQRLLYWKVPLGKADILQAARLGQWKAILPPGSKSSKDVLLFDLAKDPREQTNVAEHHPDLIKKVLPSPKK